PRTLGRLQDIARVHAITPERLQALLAGELVDESRYLPPPAGAAQARIFSTSFKQKHHHRLLMVILGLGIFPPLPIANWLFVVHVDGWIRVVCSLAGAAGAFLLYQVVRSFFLGFGFGSLERSLRAKFSQEGLPPQARPGTFVGLAPANQPRRYEKLPFWDIGLLWFAGGRLVYRVEQASFALRRTQIIDTQPGISELSFLPSKCLYVVWRDEALGSQNTFYLMLPRARSIRRAGREFPELEKRIQDWLKGGVEMSPAPD